MPANVAQAARDAVGAAEPYPDPLCRSLREAMATRMAVEPEWIVCGNGAADIIHRLVLARRPARALLVAPSFAEYERALDCAGCDAVHHHLRRDNGFDLDEQYLECLTPGIDMAFLCQPNNPTGRAIPRATLLAALALAERNNTLLVVDECFVPFLDAPDAATLLPWLRQHPSLFLVGSFTKLYAMAGLRLGFGLCADAALIAALHGAGQPWSVSSIAQAAGLAALGEGGYVVRSRAFVRGEREWLREQLSAMGIVAMGDANSLFFHTAAPDLPARLAENGILIRDCANFRGLE
jgi:threonine-phosphate decarboxylase